MTVTTPLQRHLRQALDGLEDARVELAVEEWSWLVAILAEAIGIEVGKLVIREAIMVSRQASEDAA